MKVIPLIAVQTVLEVNSTISYVVIQESSVSSKPVTDAVLVTLNATVYYQSSSTLPSAVPPDLVIVGVPEKDWPYATFRIIASWARSQNCDTAEFFFFLP